MFAVVANGIQRICKTQRELENIKAFYPYPKFQKCTTEESARWWLSQNARSLQSIRYTKYGDTAASGYASVEYYINENNIYYNIYTERVGFIKVQAGDDTKMDSRRDLLKVKVCDVHLDDMSIMHHTIAIRRILNLLGEYLDVDIVVPDVSIYLAMTKYSGKNYMIKGLQKDIATRLGAVSVTIKE